MNKILENFISKITQGQKNDFHIIKNPERIRSAAEELIKERDAEWKLHAAKNKEIGFELGQKSERNRLRKIVEGKKVKENCDIHKVKTPFCPMCCENSQVDKALSEVLKEIEE